MSRHSIPANEGFSGHNPPEHQIRRIQTKNLLPAILADNVGKSWRLGLVLVRSGTSYNDILHGLHIFANVYGRCFQ